MQSYKKNLGCQRVANNNILYANKRKKELTDFFLICWFTVFCYALVFSCFLDIVSALGTGIILKAFVNQAFTRAFFFLGCQRVAKNGKYTLFHQYRLPKDIIKVGKHFPLHHCKDTGIPTKPKYQPCMAFRCKVTKKSPNLEVCCLKVQVGYCCLCLSNL